MKVWAMLWLCMSLPLFAAVEAADAEAEIVRTLKAYVLNQYHFLTPQDVTARVINEKSLGDIPKKAASVLMDLSPGLQLLGKSLQPLQFIDERGRMVEKRHIAVEVDAKTTFWRTTEMVKKGRPLTERSVVKDYASMLGKPRRALRDKTEWFGLETRMIVAKDTVLTDTMVQHIPDIRRGDAVSILVQKGALEISVKGKAVDEGRIGDMIRVKTRLKSSRMMEGEIVDAKTIRVSMYH